MDEKRVSKLSVRPSKRFHQANLLARVARCLLAAVARCLPTTSADRASRSTRSPRTRPRSLVFLLPLLRARARARHPSPRRTSPSAPSTKTRASVSSSSTRLAALRARARRHPPRAVAVRTRCRWPLSPTCGPSTRTLNPKSGVEECVQIRKKIFRRYQLPRLVGLGGESTEKPLQSQSYGRKREKTPFLSLFEAESHLHELHTAPNTVWLHLMLRPQPRAARTSAGAASRAHTDPIWPRFEPDPHVQSPCISLYLAVSRRLGGPGAH